MANDINQVILIGRLTRDVELSYTPNNNTALARFGIACNEYRGQGKNEEVNYFDIVVWGKMAEVCNQFISKGKQVAISGKLRQERYQDKQGQNRSKVSIVANSVQFIGGQGEQKNQGQQQNNQQPPPQQPPQQGWGQQPPQQGWSQPPADMSGDIPF